MFLGRYIIFDNACGEGLLFQAPVTAAELLVIQPGFGESHFII